MRFARDSPLEGEGFEPSVPQQIRSDLGTAGPSPITVDSLATRNWKFESISLQRESGANSTPRFGDQRPVSSLSRRGPSDPAFREPMPLALSWIKRASPPARRAASGAGPVCD